MPGLLLAAYRAYLGGTHRIVRCCVERLTGITMMSSEWAGDVIESVGKMVLRTLRRLPSSEEDISKENRIQSKSVVIRKQ